MARVSITNEALIRYLEELAKLGVYGTKAGAVATTIVRKEIMRLVESNVLRPIQVITAGTDDEDDED